MKYNIKEIKHKVCIAIDILFKNDLFLLGKKVHERSVSHKLAEYLQKQFPDWHVDCEYNKDGPSQKKLDGIEECDDRTTSVVYPDIIIHQRGKKGKECNLLVIEIKTSSSKKKCDIKKLELFTSNVKYKYHFGLFIGFRNTKKPDLEWYKDGEEYNPKKRIRMQDMKKDQHKTISSIKNTNHKDTSKSPMEQ